jgi:hypothetical protein
LFRMKLALLAINILRSVRENRNEPEPVNGPV